MLPNNCRASWAEGWGKVVHRSPVAEPNIPTQPILVLRVMYFSSLVMSPTNLCITRLAAALKIGAQNYQRCPEQNADYYLN